MGGPQRYRRRCQSPRWGHQDVGSPPASATRCEGAWRRACAPRSSPCTRAPLRPAARRRPSKSPCRGSARASRNPENRRSRGRRAEDSYQSPYHGLWRRGAMCGLPTGAALLSKRTGRQHADDRRLLHEPLHPTPHGWKIKSCKLTMTWSKGNWGIFELARQRLKATEENASTRGR
jgi:hypothetical protein